jgi:DNA-binding PadR family transcriptional regulator
VVEFAVLGLLHEAPMHGYELRKRLANRLGAFQAFSYGSLYPALRRLLRAGLIAEDVIDATGEDRTRSWGRRAKRVYKLTAEGKERFATLVTEGGPEAWDDDGFGVHLAFFSRTPAEARMRILEGRRRRVEERREGLRATLARAGEQIDRYTRELHRMGLESSEREVRWLNELIEHERAEARETDRGAHQETDREAES